MMKEKEQKEEETQGREREEEEFEDDEAHGAFLPSMAASAVFVPPPPWLRSQEIART